MVYFIPYWLHPPDFFLFPPLSLPWLQAHGIEAELDTKVGPAAEAPELLANHWLRTIRERGLASPRGTAAAAPPPSRTRRPGSVGCPHRSSGTKKLLLVSFQDLFRIVVSLGNRLHFFTVSFYQKVSYLFFSVTR